VNGKISLPAGTRGATADWRELELRRSEERIAMAGLSPRFNSVSRLILVGAFYCLSEAPHQLAADDQSQKPADAARKTTEPAADSEAEPAANTGKLHGVITLEGLLPGPDETLVVDVKTSGIRNVIVYLAKPPAGAVVPPVPKSDVPLAIRNGACDPRVLVVRAGQPILVTNTDNAPNNLHTNPIRNQPTNHIIAPGKTLKLVHAQAERLPFFVSNDIVAGSRALQLVLDHPWFAITDAGGEFTISDLPAGTYEFIVWHERVGYLDRKLLVPIIAGETTRLTPQYARENFFKLAK
jgi:hypothetical protein